MPLPSGLLKIQISGDLRTFSAGATSKGRVQIFATAPLYAPGQNVILTPAQPITAAIAAAGTFLTDEFISPGDPGVSPQDMPLLVVVRTPTYNDQWYVQVPANASGVIDLADLPRSNTAPAMVTYALVSQLLEYIPRSLVDAKGDLIVATADGTVARLPAGSNGQVLASDSAQATGLRWLTGGGGGGVTDHGELTGLTPDDDHPQYLTSGRGDARYVQPGQLATVATTGAYADLTGKPAIPDTYDDLTGTVPSSALPAIAVVDYLGAADDQAEMLTFVGQRGDWCTRVDLGTTWIITGDTPSQLASWTALSYPAAPVLSVNGETGVVSLSKGDVGLPNVDNTSDVNKPVSNATQTALNGKVNSSLVDAAGDLLVGSGADTLTRLPKGSDGQVLGVDAGALAWTTPAGAGGG